MGVTQRVQGRSVFDSLAAINKVTSMGLDLLMNFAATKGGDTWFVDSSKTTSGSGKSVAQAFTTLAAAITAAGARDTILVLPGRCTEGALSIARAKSNLTIIGLGGRGAAYLQPSTAAQAGLEVLADDFSMFNFGVAGADTAAAYALRVYGSRFRAYACKLEGAAAQLIYGPGTTAQVAADTYGAGGDAILHDCELAWGTNGIVLTSSDYGSATQVRVEDSLFHNLTGTHVDENDVGGSGVGRDIWVIGNTFARDEVGAEPTQYIDLDSVGTTGVVAHNRFATTVHASALIALAAGVLYVGNQCEQEGPATGGGTAGRPD